MHNQQQSEQRRNSDEKVNIKRQSSSYDHKGGLRDVFFSFCDVLFFLSTPLFRRLFYSYCFRLAFGDGGGFIGAAYGFSLTT